MRLIGARLEGMRVGIGPNEARYGDIRAADLLDDIPKDAEGGHHRERRAAGCHIRGRYRLDKGQARKQKADTAQQRWQWWRLLPAPAAI